MKYLNYIALFSLVWLVACNQQPTNTEVLQAGIGNSNEAPKQQLFVTINQEIFNKSCNYGECHGGMFEPNLSTLNSAYYSLVYHPIVKNTKDSSFTYRVIPYQPENSVLHERLSNCCYVNKDDRMPIYGGSIPDEKIALITAWIKDGARDQFGNLPVGPDEYEYVEVDTNKSVSEGALFSLFATNMDGTIYYDNMRVDDDFNNSFKAPKNDSIRFVLIPINNFESNLGDAQLYIRITSTEIGNYDLATTKVKFNGQWGYEAVLPPRSIKIKPTNYMSYVLRGPNKESIIMQFPRDNSPDFFKNNWSFVFDESL